MVSLPSKYDQGDRQWEQRVTMQPVAKKGALWGGEVFLRLRYASPQVCCTPSQELLARFLHITPRRVRTQACAGAGV